MFLNTTENINYSYRVELEPPHKKLNIIRQFGGCKFEVSYLNNDLFHGSDHGRSVYYSHRSPSFWS